MTTEKQVESTTHTEKVTEKRESPSSHSAGTPAKNDPENTASKGDREAEK